MFFVVSLSSEPVVDEKGATLIDPAGYAFIIWAPIFLLSLAYAVYQALPSRQRDTFLRRVGWPLAGAFFLSGLWEIAAPLGRLGVAQVLIAGMLVCLAVAYLRLVRSGRASLSWADRWLVALPIGVYFGVVANQYQALVFTTVVAAVCVVLVVLALFAGGRSRPFGAPAAQH